jgi:hypothetical protein
VRCGDVPGDGEDLACILSVITQTYRAWLKYRKLTIGCLALSLLRLLGLLLLLLRFLPPRPLAACAGPTLRLVRLTGPIFAIGVSLRSLLLSSFNAMGGGGSLTSSRCGVIGGLLGSGTLRGSTSSSNRLLLLEKVEIYEMFFFWIRSRREGRLVRRGRFSINVGDGAWKVCSTPGLLARWSKLQQVKPASYAVHSQPTNAMIIRGLLGVDRCTAAPDTRPVRM